MPILCGAAEVLLMGCLMCMLPETNSTSEEILEM